MIPVSSKESIDYVDEDKVAWKFKPKTGSLERELFDLYDDKLEWKDRLDKVKTFIAKIVVSPKEGTDFNSDEHAEIIRIWNIANRLKPEEKKS